MLAGSCYLMSFHEYFKFLLSCHKTCSGTFLRIKFHASLLFVFVMGFFLWIDRKLRIRSKRSLFTELLSGMLCGYNIPLKYLWLAILETLNTFKSIGLFSCW